MNMLLYSTFPNYRRTFILASPAGWLLRSDGGPCSSMSSRRLARSNRLDDTAALAELRVAGIDGGAALAATEIAGPEELARYAAGAQVNTDDGASLEYRIADHVLRGTGDDAEAILVGLGGGG